LLFLIISILLLTSCSASDDFTSTVNEDIPPVLPDNTILRPEFKLKDVTFSAGTAFAVELEEENVSLVLTA